MPREAYLAVIVIVAVVFEWSSSANDDCVYAVLGAYAGAGAGCGESLVS